MTPFPARPYLRRCEARFHGNPVRLAVWIALCFALGCSWGDGGGGYIQKRFDEIDSVLSRTAVFFGARSKGNESADGVFRKLLDRYPEITNVRRTDSKGLIIDETGGRGRSAAGQRIRASDSAWHANPARTLAPWHGPLRMEGRRPYLIWSRPVFVRSAVGKNKFDGVVAFTIDVFTCFKDFAARVNGPFEILLDNKSFYYLSWSDTIPFDETKITVSGGIAFWLRLPKTGVQIRPQADLRKENAAPRDDDADSSVKPEEDGDTSREGAADTQGGASGNVWLWFAAAALLVAVLFGAVLLVDRGRRGRAVRKRARFRTDDALPSAAPAAQEATPHAGDEIQEIITIGPAVPAERSPGLPSGVSTAVGGAKNESDAPRSGGGDVERILGVEGQVRIRNEVRKRAEEEYAGKIRVEEIKSLRDEIRAELAASVRAELEKTEREAIYKKELDALTAEVKRETAENNRASPAETQRELLRFAENDELRAERLAKIEGDLREEISGTQREKIRADLLEKVRGEERARIESEERAAIAEAERGRLLSEEAPSLREEIRRKIRNEELDGIRESVKSEIYLETVQTIRKNIEEKYASAVREQLAGLKKGLGKKARADLKSGIEEEYRGLAESLEGLLAFLAENDSLKSLGQTVTLLAEEKKKYKYFNLNAAQTESLLDYLRRVYARFGIYLDAVDQRVRGMMNKLGSLKNKLDSEE
jgi:hypothetical protein